MGASSYIGRVGGLAAAFGIGAAVLTGPAVAWASPSADSAPSDSASTSDSAGSPNATRSSAGRSHSRGSTLGPQSASATAPSTSSPSRAGIRVPNTAADVDAAESVPTPGPAAAEVDAPPQRNSGRSSAAATDPAPSATHDSAPVTQPDTAAVPAAPASVEAPVAVPAAAAAATPAAATSAAATTSTPTQQSLSSNSSASVKQVPTLSTVVATVVNHISAAITNVVTQVLQSFVNSPLGQALDTPANWAWLAAARRQLGLGASSVADASQVAQTPASPVLVLNGYNVVPTTQQVVTTFYGPFTNFPGFPGVQGEQEFNLVNRSTQETVGSFKALVTYDRSASALGLTNTQLVVTEVLSGTPGTGAGKTPPVGSVISSTGDGVNYGTIYSAMPKQSGGGVVSYGMLTPFGTIPMIAPPYNAARTLTDYISVNTPLKLGNGLYIAPTTPSTEEFTSSTGLPPLFMAVQGSQAYSIYDSTHTAVGNFQGLVTTTSDFFGLYTKAILVTSSDGGSAPPAGTVYNIINFGNKDIYMLYSSTPSQSGGDVISTKLVTPLGSVSLPFSFNASKPPAQKPLKVPGGYSLVPTSDLQVAGINGLPPRELITQGYQQFDVIDAHGTKVGSVDADVMRQWDIFGGVVDAVMVTKVTAGEPGTGAINVPPVGSVFNFRPYGIPGFSDFYSSIPTSTGDKITYQVITPLGVLPAFLPVNMSAGLGNVSFYNPFV